MAGEKFFPGDAQAAIRAVTGSTNSYNGDWGALFDLAGIGAGDWNGRFIQWCNNQFSTSFDNFPEAFQYTLDYAHTNGWAATVSSGPDWANFDNSKSGAEQLIVTGGGVQIGMAVPLSSTAGACVYYDSTQLGAVGFTINADKTITEGSTPINVTNAVVSGIPEKPIVIRLTDTRAFVISLIEATLDYHVALLGWSGGEVTLLDEHTITGWTDANRIEFRGCRLNDTQALIIGSDDSGTDETYVAVIDCASDTITEGTRRLAYNLAGTDAPTSNARPGITRLTDTSFVVAGLKKTSYFTVSGTTITYQDNENIIAAATNIQDDKMCVRLSDTEYMILYETDVNDFSCNIFTISGGTISRGSTVTSNVVVDAFFFCEQESAALLHTDDDGNRFVGLVAQVTSPSAIAELTVLKVASDGTVTKVVDGQAVSATQYEHISIFPVGTDGTRALIQCQEETTSPVKQVGIRIIEA